MKRVLLATHGHFASGIKSSAEIILGEQDNLYAIDAYTTDVSFEQQLDEYLSGINLEKDVLLVLTDLFGGSVNQLLANKLQDDNVHIITGLNLPLLLEIQMLTVENCTKKQIQQIVENSRQQIKYVEVEEEAGKDDFDF